MKKTAPTEVERRLSIRDMCERYGVSRTTWREWEVAGETPACFKIRNRKFYRPSTVDAWEVGRERDQDSRASA